MAIGMGMSYCIVISTSISYVVVEGVNMLAEQFKQKRFEEGFAQGETKGHTDRQKEWEEWNWRRHGSRGQGRGF